MTDDFTIREQAHKSCEKNCNGTFHEEVYCEGFYNGYKAGYHECEKEHEWHDLEKDPKDLPKENRDYIVKVREYGDILVKIGKYWKKEKMFTGSYLKELDVIKWKEIE